MRKNCLHIQEICRKIMNDSMALVMNTGVPDMFSPQRPLDVPQKRLRLFVLLDSGADKTLRAAHFSVLQNTPREVVGGHVREPHELH